MHLKQYYLTCINQLGYAQDPDQLRIVDAFAEVQNRVVQNGLRPTPGLFDKIGFLHSSRNTLRNQGVYLWGGVGRGKTWIMDLFYNSTGIDHKIRLHFHQFMRRVHAELNDIKGQRDPLKKIAQQWAAKYRLICLDEFHVTDITDAMLLYGLLEALFRNQVILVTTSNVAPDDLYQNGLQRDRFIPAIELIKHFTRVIQLGGENDYRLRGEQDNKVYYAPLNEETAQCFAAHYDAAATHSAATEVDNTLQTIDINHRPIAIVAATEAIIWLTYDSLCCTARSAIDYIELAQRYHSVFVSDIQQMNDAHDDRARRFINLIDVLYDHKTRVILSAQTPPEQLYQGRRLQFEFGRTLSRIKEMQTHDYLERSRAAQENVPLQVAQQ